MARMNVTAQSTSAAAALIHRPERSDLSFYCCNRHPVILPEDTAAAGLLDGEFTVRTLSARDRVPLVIASRNSDWFPTAHSPHRFPPTSLYFIRSPHLLQSSTASRGTNSSIRQNHRPQSRLSSHSPSSNGSSFKMNKMKWTPEHDSKVRRSICSSYHRIEIWPLSET
jgi:hypothetical protein